MASFMSTPSSMKLLPCSRWPLTYGRPPPVFFRLLNDEGFGVVTPAVNRVAVDRLRPWIGSFST